MDLTEADKESWRQLWNNLHNTHYSVYYDELAADCSVTLWRRFDAFVKFLELSTASGSAIAGWTLWNQPGFRVAWVMLAATAAITALAHAVLNLSEKIKDDTLIYSEFKKVRLELERLKSKMEVKPTDSLKDYMDEYFAILEKFGSAQSHKKPDFLFTDARANSVQSMLNKRLGYE